MGGILCLFGKEGKASLHRLCSGYSRPEIWPHKLTLQCCKHLSYFSILLFWIFSRSAILYRPFPSLISSLSPWAIFWEIWLQMLPSVARCASCGEYQQDFRHLSGNWVPVGGGGGGVEVECWLYNNHYSAEMAIRRGLSVLGPETLWLDFPRVAILLLSLDLSVPLFSFCILLKQFNKNLTGHRTDGMSQRDVLKRRESRFLSKFNLLWSEAVSLEMFYYQNLTTVNSRWQNSTAVFHILYSVCCSKPNKQIALLTKWSLLQFFIVFYKLPLSTGPLLMWTVVAAK